MTTPECFTPVPADQVAGIFGLHATLLLSAAAGGVDDVMTVSSACPLGHGTPFRLMSVIGKNHFTRGLIEKSRRFAMSVPTAAIAGPALKLGFIGLAKDPEKLAHCRAEIFRAAGYDVPLVAGSAAWAVFDLVDEPEMAGKHDILIGDCVAAWADPRIYENGHWKLAGLPTAMKPLHYWEGMNFYVPGEAVTVK
ncbi:flavin reductase family protein [Sutterella sp.]|uniref:flavin reductase family protein n=1 Tax=Sutterella sp. TaxID=1981025 RepID=UPI0026DEAB1C|nr:flavin reductase [Sutterella sp.]MDO5532844.1 flavin reductase [Sutterella sp.]